MKINTYEFWFFEAVFGTDTLEVSEPELLFSEDVSEALDCSFLEETFLSEDIFSFEVFTLEDVIFEDVSGELIF